MRRFPLPPIHRSTLVLAVLVFVLGIAANFGGDYHPPEFGESTARMSFGWPWAYGDWERDRYNNFRFDRWTFWRLNQVNIWYPFAFVGNLVALLLITATIGAIWEWRRRKIKHLWQFTLADILLGSLAVMAFYGVERWLCRDVFAEREFRLTLENPWMFDGGGQSLGIAERPFSHNQDVPADWFWELFSIPETHRPYRRLALRLHLSRSVGDEIPTMGARQLELLGRCRELREFACSAFKLNDDSELKPWPVLQMLQLIDVDDTQIRSLPTCPELQEVYFYHGTLTDNGLRALQRQPNLKHLYLYNLVRIDGTGLSSLTTGEALSLRHLKLNNQGLSALGEMPELRMLDLTLLIDYDNPQALGWRLLGKSRNLKRLSITDNAPNRANELPIYHEVDDAGLAAIATLPQLEELFVGSTLITDDGVRSLATCKKLKNLKIEARHGLLTDATLDFFAEKKWPNELFIIGDNFSTEAIQRLQKVHPGVRIQP